MGWVVWAALAASKPDVTAQVTGFAVRGPEEIRVEITVGADPGPVTCPLRALDADRETVGATTVRGGTVVGRVETTVPVRPGTPR